MRVSPRILALGAIGLLILIQVFRPSRSNPPVDVRQDVSVVAKVDPAALAILDRSCNDCHSNRTVWPWYSKVAPVSWVVASDVSNARSHMNFSEWGKYPEHQRQSHLDNICKLVTQHDMPLFSYLLVHHEAALSQADREAICQWTRQATENTLRAEPPQATSGESN